MQIDFCKKCLAMSTRPRITFNGSGVCVACQWTEEKKTLDWDRRAKQLTELLSQAQRSAKNRSSQFDCLVPVSGGKDGSYVAHMLKSKFAMNPLTVTIKPPLSLSLGEQNLQAFIDTGYDHISVSPNPRGMRKLNKYGLEAFGSPYYGWLISIHTAVAHIAESMAITLIFYGEDGEVEYGGDSANKYNPTYSFDYQKKVYLEGGLDKALEYAGLDDHEKFWFTYPKNIETSDIKLAHWSYFESWDPYRNYLVAREHCGLRESDLTNSGTFTNFAQNDQSLYSLHTYLMYLKFGFGRANQDACIEIRRGAMAREQGVNLVRLYDGKYPSEYEEEYLAYFELSRQQFFEILKKHTNKQLFDWSGDRVVAKFEIG